MPGKTRRKMKVDPKSQETPSKKAPPQQKIEVILVWFKVDKTGRLEFQEVYWRRGSKHKIKASVQPHKNTKQACVQPHKNTPALSAHAIIPENI